ARRERSRSAAARTRRHLRHGPRIRRFRATVRAASGRCLFCHPRQVEHDAKRLYSAPSDRTEGIICDQTIALAGIQTSQHYPEHLRRIRFKDPETGKTLVFLTNQRMLPAATICTLYKCHWQVELFFKWIKQHLRIKAFFGTTENAVNSQIWIAVSVYE